MAPINYKKFLLNRVTVTLPIIENLENCLTTDDVQHTYSFHKIMLHNWTDNEVNLFEVLSNFFVASFIPVNFVTQNGITTFYTSSLSFVNKVLKLDFLFPYMRSMCSLDILLNDKTSMELFNEDISVEDKVSEIVSSRFKNNCELDLSNFCHDPGFADKKIYFYKLSLLSQFKILMLRMGRDTKFLNLSNNNLSQIPLEILNFFIKGDLLGIDLSNNDIPSLVELHRISSKIEKLFIEGNPLCEGMDPLTYIKHITVKFPRLMELDGIKINNHGIMMPFYKTFLRMTDKKTRMVIENFVTLYFAHYDSPQRFRICNFYNKTAHLTISTCIAAAENEPTRKLCTHSRNVLKLFKLQEKFNKRFYKDRASIVGVLSQLPETVHDPTTFTIDVLHHDRDLLTVIIDGVYKENGVNPDADQFFNFRRTFIFKHYAVNAVRTQYYIIKEMFSISFATQELKEASFQHPVRHQNQLSLINPEPEERDHICSAFKYYTQLKSSEAEARLRKYDWDLRNALKAFIQDLKLDIIPVDSFINQDNLSDISSLLDKDEID